MCDRFGFDDFVRQHRRSTTCRHHEDHKYGTDLVGHYLTHWRYANLLSQHEERLALCGVSKSAIFLTCYDHGTGVAHAWDQSQKFDLQESLFGNGPGLGYAFFSFADVGS